MAKQPPSKESEIRARIIQKYVRLVKRLKRIPTEAELRDEAKLTRNTIRYYFKNPQDLKRTAAATEPGVFEHLIDQTLFTDENMKKLEQLIGRTSVAIVSTAVTGCKVHRGFLNAINQYAEKRKGIPLFIPVTDPAAKVEWSLDPKLSKNHIVFGDLALNSNIYINGIKMSAKQLDPTTSLNRMGHRMSFIFGSPKQRMTPQANSNLKHPHVKMGTGAVTLPNYTTDRYMSERTAKLAHVDHKIGAIIVELDSDEKYYFRQIQATKSGAFVDLGKLYFPDGRVSDYPPEYFIMGDLHPGETDPVAFYCWKEVIQTTKARNVVIHDGVNGHSISHWLEGKVLEKAQMASRGMTNLAEEGKLCAKTYREILSWLPPEGKLYMVASNHNDFLYRYLNDRRFVRDHENLDFVVRELLPKAMQGEDPSKVLVELFLTPEERARIIWWTSLTDYRYADVQLAAHGDKGPKGVRGTLKNQAESYGACFVGHSHTPGIYLDAWQVGTTSYRHMPYDRGGPSSAMHTSGLLYPNGSRQLINCIDGKWRLPPRVRPQPKKKH